MKTFTLCLTASALFSMALIPIAKGSPSADNALQAQALAVVKAIDLNEIEAEKPTKTQAVYDTADKARAEIAKLPLTVTVCGSPAPPITAELFPERAKDNYCAPLREDVKGLMSQSTTVALAATLVHLHNSQGKAKLAKAISDYHDYHAWLMDRLQKWNVH